MSEKITVKDSTEKAVEWKYVETKTGAHVFAGRFVVKAHWDGGCYPEDIRSMMRLIAKAPSLYAACAAIVRWDEAEKKALPYDDDGGRAFRERMRLCDEAMTKARAALDLVDDK